MSNKKYIEESTKNHIIQMFQAKEKQDQTLDNLKDLIKRFLGGQPEYEFLNHDNMLVKIRMEINTTSQKPGSLVQKDWKEWLYPESGKPVDSKREEIEWNFFDDYMKEVKLNYGEKGAKKLSEETLEVLRYLEDPLSKGSWYRKGLVVGQVQSGKTSNYNGLICRAADAGYRIFIILAGAHNDLRAQTQKRIDNDFFGKDTSHDSKKSIGVGNNKNHPNCFTLTSSVNDGDFKSNTKDALSISDLTNEIPPLFVVCKKHVSILDNLYKWFNSFVTANDGKPISMPMLFIDDECDYASVDTNKNTDSDDEYSPTKINLNIRKILSLFSKKSYVGYTATPYANILIHREVTHPDFGEDLFPDNFIVSINPPSNYNGPLDYFGLEQIENNDPESIDELPLTRIVKDHGVLQEENISSIPDTLKEALRVFILSCAARISRGQGFKDNSMLIHTARFTNHQAIIKGYVDDEIEIIRNDIKYGNQNSLKELWENDFVKTSTDILNSDSYNETVKIGIKIDNWSNISKHLESVMDKLLIKEVNASAGDILEYDKYDNGINYIAIGGDKLSRGLTLEGLTVSYYLRSASFYDTLMQMGRWFGYRVGYLDLCRLYTTYGLIINYRKITIATRKLMIDFEHMVRMGKEPKDFGMKVQNDPGRLTVTNLGKRRWGEFIDISYKGKSPETMAIYTDEKNSKINFVAVNELLENSSGEVKKGFGYVYEGIKSDRVIDFLSSINIHPKNNRFNHHLMNEYIKLSNEQNALESWIICLISIKNSKEISRVSYGPNKRKPGMSLRKSTALYDSKAKDVHFHHGFKDKQNHIDPLVPDYKNHGIVLIYNLYGSSRNSDEMWGNKTDPCLGIVLHFPSRGPDIKARYLFDHLYAKNLKEQEKGYDLS